MKDFEEFFLNLILILFIVFLFACPIVYNFGTRIESLEMLHNQTICPECKSVIDK